MIPLPTTASEVAAAIRAKYGNDPSRLTPSERDAAGAMFLRLLHLVSRTRGGFRDYADDELFDRRGKPLIPGVTLQDRADACWGVSAVEWRDLVEQTQSRKAVAA